MTVQPSKHEFTNGLCPMCRELNKSGITVGRNHVTWPGGELHLTPSQARILHRLVQRRWASMDDLIWAVYGVTPHGGTAFNALLRIQLYRLRIALREAQFPGEILGGPGRASPGYRLVLSETIEKGG